MAEKQSRTPKVKVEEPVVETTAEGTAVVETTTTTVGTATTVTTERHPTEVPTGTQARPTTTKIERAPAPHLPVDFSDFETALQMAPPAQWPDLVEEKMQELRRTRDAIEPGDLTAWKDQLVTYCIRLQEWRNADR